MKKWNWKAALAGAAAGLANGFFGAGGGMILVPLLSKQKQAEDKLCFTTALAVILPLTMVSIVIYWTHDALSLSDAWPYLVGGFFGGIGGGLLIRKISARWLHLAMGLLILWGGIRLLL